MLTSREKAEDNISRKLNSLVDKKELQQEICMYAFKKYNLPLGNIMDILSFRRSISEISEWELFVVADSLDNFFDKSNLKSLYFTESEIKTYARQKIKTKKFKFPIEIPCIQISNDQWIGGCDVHFLMSLKNAKLIKYNENAQRTLKRKIVGDEEHWQIALNKRAIKSIKESYLNNSYIPNTITLNIPEDEFDFKYDNDRKLLIINSISSFDISDGYHRYVAMSNLYDQDNDWNYPMELRIIRFSESKTHQFIFQEDQKTQMKKIESDSMNMNAPENICLERLNANIMFDLKGQIARSRGHINFSEFGTLVHYWFFKKITSKENINKTIIQVERKLLESINYIVSQNNNLLNHQFSFAELAVLTQAIARVTEDNEIDILNRVSLDLTKADELLDKKIYSRNTPGAALTNNIKQVYGF